ncbi:hypothetical protein D3C72_1630880 [compost metagenome]
MRSDVKGTILLSTHRHSHSFNTWSSKCYIANHLHLSCRINDDRRRILALCIVRDAILLGGSLFLCYKRRVLCFDTLNYRRITTMTIDVYSLTTRARYINDITIVKPFAAKPLRTIKNTLRNKNQQDQKAKQYTSYCNCYRCTDFSCAQLRIC